MKVNNVKVEHDIMYHEGAGYEVTFGPQNSKWNTINAKVTAAQVIGEAQYSKTGALSLAESYVKCVDEYVARPAPTPLNTLSLHPEQWLEGKSVIVTGASSGIGLAAAIEAYKRGANVIGFDLNPNVESIFSGNEKLMGFTVNATDYDTVKQAVDATADNYGGLYGIVSNVGWFPSSKLIRDMDFDFLKQATDVNFTSHVALTNFAIPHLTKNPKSAIVYTGSSNVFEPGAGQLAYSAPKVAMERLMHLVAIEESKNGLRSNMVSPGPVFDTNLYNPLTILERATAKGQTWEQYTRGNFLKTLIPAAEVGRTIVSLLHPDSVVNAQNYSVDGGRPGTMH
jgi:NAD(P)-dependent dehydrogenase (short-subunit alcohol dehydrogenase family)